MTYNSMYSQVSFKASHNSYERDEQPVIRQLDWHKKDVFKDGCRGLEIDIHQSPNLWMWSVHHIGTYEPGANKQLSEYLQLLRQWSGLNPKHDVVTVTIDVKSKPNDLCEFPRWFDMFLDAYLGEEKLFRPRDLMDGAKNLVAGAMANGWPTLRDLEGQFIFCLSGREDVKKTYSRGNKTRLCFADKKFGPKDKYPDVTSGNRVFYNMNVEQDWRWDRAAEWFATRKGLVTRGYGLNVGDAWRRALKSNLNILATDKVRKYDWATVGKTPFRPHS